MSELPETEWNYKKNIIYNNNNDSIIDSSNVSKMEKHHEGKMKCNSV